MKQKHFKHFFSINAFLFCCCLISLPLRAAEPLPNHDIALFKLTQNDGQLEISEAKIIAASSGYDNQPSFSENGKAIYFTRIEGDNADMWQWQSQTGKAVKLGESALSHFSPTQIPFEPDSLSTVRVEADNTQRLWKYSPKNGYSVIFNSIKPVGYHVWSEKNIAMFILGEPHTLQVTHLGKEKTQVIDKDIGRCLQRRNGSLEISYTVLQAGKMQLKTYDFKTQKVASWIALPDNVQDYVWYDNQRVISSDGENLLVSSIVKDSKWQSIKNLSKLKLTGISRLAISPDKSQLAVVYIKS